MSKSGSVTQRKYWAL